MPAINTLPENNRPQVLNKALRFLRGFIAASRVEWFWQPLEDHLSGLEDPYGILLGGFEGLLKTTSTAPS